MENIILKSYTLYYSSYIHKLLDTNRKKMLSNSTWMLGVHMLTVPLLWPKHSTAFAGFWHITPSLPCFVNVLFTILPTETSSHVSVPVSLEPANRKWYGKYSSCSMLSILFTQCISVPCTMRKYNNLFYLNFWFPKCWKEYVLGSHSLKRKSWKGSEPSLLV